MLYSVALGINDVQLYKNLCSCTILFVVLLAPENSSRALPSEKEKCIVSLILGQVGRVRARSSVSCLHQSWALSHGKTLVEVIKASNLIINRTNLLGPSALYDW